MSKRGYTSRREAAIKQLRAKAHREQTHFQAALETSAVEPWMHNGYIKSGFKSRSTRNNNPDRQESDYCLTRKAQLQASKGASALAASEDVCGCEICEAAYIGTVRTSVPMTLEDIGVRPAKAKGIKKEYDVLDPIQRVIVLDDDNTSIFSEEDWEDIYAEQQAMDKEPYSSVVRGKAG